MYRINQNCIACGNCMAVCPENAIQEENPHPINGERHVQGEACTGVGPTEAIAVSAVADFPDTGKFPPSQGDLIYLGNDGFGFVDNVIIDGSQCEVDFYATIYDYTYEGNTMEIKQPDGMIMPLSYVVRPTEAQKREFRQHLDDKNLDFDYGRKKVINIPITRVEVGNEYYYLDTDMAERTAIDDGVNSGIHYARFLQGNYFKKKDRASLLGQEVRKMLKNLIMPNGSWE